MKTKFYEVSFILEQQSPYTDWIEEVLASGLRIDEYIYQYTISEIPSHEMEVH
jgi:hypothetical protein